MPKSSLTEKELLLKISDRVDELNDKLHRLEVDRVRTVAEMQSVLEKQEHNLAVHIKRTDIAEANINMIQKDIKPVLQGLGFLKVIAKIGTYLVGLIAAYKKFH